MHDMLVISFVSAAILTSGSRAFAAGGTPDGTLTMHEEILGKLDPQEVEGNGVLWYRGMQSLANDGLHVTFFTPTRAIIDGVPGKLWQKVRGYPDAVSPEGSRLAYLAKGDDGTHWVVDGVAGPAFDYPTLEDPVPSRVQFPPNAGTGGGGAPAPSGPRFKYAFSADGRHFAYLACKANRWFVVLDGKILPHACDAATEMVFSPDGRLALLIGGFRGDRKKQIVLDGKDGPEFDSIGLYETQTLHQSQWIQFSADGKTAAYAGIGSNETSFVVNGQGRFAAGKVVSIYFGADDQAHCVSIEQDAEKSYLCVDGVRGPGFRWIRFHPQETLANSVVYKGQGNWHSQFVINGQAGPEFGGVQSLKVSPDGKHVVYLGTDFNADSSIRQQQIMVDGKSWGPVPGLCRNIVISPDSQHVAAETYLPFGTHTVFLDGKPGPAVDNVVDDLYFAPVGDRFHYNVRIGLPTSDGRTNHITFDFQQPSEFITPEAFSMVYSPDGKHLAFVAQKDGKYSVTIDGVSKWEVPERTTWLYWSANSEHVMYWVKGGAAGTAGYDLIVDGKRVNSSDRGYALPIPEMSFDGRHMAYEIIEDDRKAVNGSDGGMAGATDERVWQMVVDGERGPALEAIAAGPVITARGELQYIGLRQESDAHTLVRFTMTGFDAARPVKLGYMQPVAGPWSMRH